MRLEQPRGNVDGIALRLSSGSICYNHIPTRPPPSVFVWNISNIGKFCWSSRSRPRNLLPRRHLHRIRDFLSIFYNFLNDLTDIWFIIIITIWKSRIAWAPSPTLVTFATAVQLLAWQAPCLPLKFTCIKTSWTTKTTSTYTLEYSG